MKVSIIIPVYNEEKTIAKLLESVANQRGGKVELEIVVVNDCSKDRSKEIIEENKEFYDVFVSLEKNLGKGGAVIAGLKKASGDFILFQDADLEYDPVEHPDMFDVLAKYDPDVLYGSRMLAPKVTRVFYFYNKIGNFLITNFFNMLYNTTFTDIYSCYFCFRRTLVDPNELKVLGWAQQAEILAKAIKRGKVFYEVPISYMGRSYDEGKKIRPYHIINVFVTIFLERFK